MRATAWTATRVYQTSRSRSATCSADFRELSSKTVSIAAENFVEKEKIASDDDSDKKKKFLEKRKTYEFHEYPEHPLPENVEEEDEDEEEGLERIEEEEA